MVLTAWVAVLITDTVLLRPLATYTAVPSGLKARALGVLPTSMVLTTRVAVSTTDTVLSPPLATYTVVPSGLSARARGRAPTGTELTPIIGVSTCGVATTFFGRGSPVRRLLSASATALMGLDTVGDVDCAAAAATVGAAATTGRDRTSLPTTEAAPTLTVGGTSEAGADADRTARDPLRPLVGVVGLPARTDDDAVLADDVASGPVGERPSVLAEAVPGAAITAIPNPAPSAPTCNHCITPKLRARSRRC
jgi:hypothetical protein